jgi:hypothetical protein
MVKLVGLVTAVPPDVPDGFVMEPTVPVVSPWIARTWMPLSVIVVAVVGVPEPVVNVSVNEVAVGVTVCVVGANVPLVPLTTVAVTAEAVLKVNPDGIVKIIVPAPTSFVAPAASVMTGLAASGT